MPTDPARSVAEIVARFLVARGVDRIYGLQGGHIQPIWDHLVQIGVRIIDARDHRPAEGRDARQVRDARRHHRRRRPLRPDEQIAHLGSVGREWAGSGAIKLLDAARNEVPDGATGELFSRTPYVFNATGRTTRRHARCFDGAWCSVGDLARRDEHGFIHLVDRKSNMIISGGENIYPSEVEAVLAAHPAVQDGVVVGVPDPKWGETVLAALVLRAGQRASPAELEAERAAWCRERIAGFKRPRAYAFITEAELPRTATGKVQHRALRERLIADAHAAAKT